MQQFVVIAPTFNNAGTLAGVVDAVRALRLPVIVVNDGCTDTTEQVLAARAGTIEVVTHPCNLGKAAALRSGFDRAIELGYTHVLTLATDGQHDTGDVVPMIDLSRAHPDALILGARDTNIPGYPLGNRIARRISNAVVWLHSGTRVTDSQCGLRVYPLVLAQLPTRAPRYGYETEILVRCGWANVAVIEHRVRCVYELSTGRVSHFRPLLDTARSVGMHVRLLTRSLTPIRPMRLHSSTDRTTTGTIIQRLLRWFSPMRAWRSIRNDRAERRRFAVALSLGVLIANLPIYGVQSLLSLALAKRWRLHPLAVLAGSHLSTPPVGPLLIAAAIATGHFMLHGRAATLAEFDPTQIGYFELLRRVAIEWIIGSILCGIVLSVLTYLSVQLMLRVVPTSPSNARVL